MYRIGLFPGVHYKIKGNRRVKQKLTDWFLTDEAVCVGCAGIRPEARDLSSLQVSAEA